GEPTAETQSAIEGGQIETGYPAVAYLTGGALGACTAVLIASSWALTAGHCQQHGEPLTFWTVDSLGNFTADAVQSTLPEPNTQTLPLHPAPPIVNIQPMPLGRSLPSPQTTCFAVGFGLDQAASPSSGVKRWGWERIVSVPSSIPGIISVVFDTAIADH